MDETLFFDSLSARFKPWYHSWPYVPESTTINPCLKIVIFYRTSPELPTLLVVSTWKAAARFLTIFQKSAFDTIIRQHLSGWRHCQNTFSFSSFLRAGDGGGSLACVETPRSLKKKRKKKIGERDVSHADANRVLLFEGCIAGKASDWLSC